MKNLLKFFLFVALLSLAISALYDYQLHRGRLSTPGRRTPEKYTLADNPNVDPKQVAPLEEGAFSRSRFSSGSGGIEDRRSGRETAQAGRFRYGPSRGLRSCHRQPVWIRGDRD